MTDKRKKNRKRHPHRGIFWMALLALGIALLIFLLPGAGSGSGAGWGSGTGKSGDESRPQKEAADTEKLPPEGMEESEKEDTPVSLAESTKEDTPEKSPIIRISQTVIFCNDRECVDTAAMLEAIRGADSTISGGVILLDDYADNAVWQQAVQALEDEGIEYTVEVETK